VDVIYIGTPPNFHHQNAKEALLAGKHVLCEKPFTFDLEELDELIALAKSKNLFLMESAPLISYQYYSVRLAANTDSSQGCVDSVPSAGRSCSGGFGFGDTRQTSSFHSRFLDGLEP
jgi:hypothetical protein